MDPKAQVLALDLPFRAGIKSFAVYTLGDLAARVKGEAIGDPSLPITGMRPFELAVEGDLTLAAKPRYWENLEDSPAAAAIVPEAVAFSGKPLLRTPRPKLAFARLLPLFFPRPFEPHGVSSQAAVGPNCRISPDVTIEPFVRVGEGVEIAEQVIVHSGTAVGAGCRLGRGCVLHPNVVLYPGVTLGKGVIIHGGSVIGADGFGYVFDGDRQVKLPQTGGVEIGDDVEIGANSCVDRATFGKTVLERGVKIDNLVHIGHNCRIGENTVIVGCVGISGSVTIGRNCVLAGQAGVIDHVRIGDGVTVMVKTAVTKDVPPNTVISGMFGRPHREQLKIEAALRRLPQIYAEWRKLKARLGRED